MAEWQADVHIFDDFQAFLSEEWLQEVVAVTLASELPHATATLELVIADDNTVHILNQEYRGEDTVTDVLAFPFIHPGEDEGQGEAAYKGNVCFVIPSDFGNNIPLSIGEIIISYPQALRQAQAAHHSIHQEVALLVAHGVLHLLGYTHADPEKEAVMWERQGAVLSRLFPQEAT